MSQILLLSDNHSHIDERILHYAESVDEIWHAGDIGNLQVLESLEKLKPLKAVFGNIDGTEVRKRCPEYQVFQSENKKVLILHIGGYPGRYSLRAQELITKHRPDVFISGHSHILKAMHDTKNHLLHLNPGACGKTGWHQVRTMLRFQIQADEIKDLEIIELGKR